MKAVDSGILYKGHYPCKKDVAVEKLIFELYEHHKLNSITLYSIGVMAVISDTSQSLGHMKLKLCDSH